jgi:hypothetical protein
LTIADAIKNGCHITSDELLAAGLTFIGRDPSDRLFDGAADHRGNWILPDGVFGISRRLHRPVILPVSLVGRVAGKWTGPPAIHGALNWRALVQRISMPVMALVQRSRTRLKPRSGLLDHCRRVTLPKSA